MCASLMTVSEMAAIEAGISRETHFQIQPAVRIVQQILSFFAQQSESPPRDLIVPHFHQLIVVLGLTLTGVVLGQVVRRVRHLAEDYARRVENSGEGRP